MASRRKAGEDPTVVVSTSEMTGAMPAMPAGQSGGDALSEVVDAPRQRVPEMGGKHRTGKESRNR